MSPIIILEHINFLCCDGPKTYHKINLMTTCVNQAPGPDDRSPRLLKELSEEIAYPVTQIFNRSLKEGDVPLD